MKKLENRGFTQICEKLLMALLCILMADCCIFGAGRFVMAGPLGFRMALVALVLLVSVPVMIRDFRFLIQRKVLWIFAAFAAWLVFQTVRGVAAGNDRSILASDLKGYCYFAVLVPAVCVLNSKQRVHTLMKTMLYASAVLSVMALILTCLYKWDHELFLKIHSWDPQELMLDVSIVIEKKVPRLFFKSTNYFLAGCAFSIYFYGVDVGKSRWHYPVITGLCLFGMLMSYTRAVYLAAFLTAASVTLMIMLLGGRDMKIDFWKHLIAATLVFAVITGGLSAAMGTNYIEHGLRRVVATFGTAEEAQADAPASDGEEQNNAQTMTVGSDLIRADTLRELNGWIRKAPVFGHGLGKAIACRADGRTEYFYHETVVKTGIVGLMLYLMPALWMAVSMIRKKGLNKPDKLTAGCWLAVLLGFMGFSYYNPYMNASLGILFYCCAVGIFENLKCRRDVETD